VDIAIIVLALTCVANVFLGLFVYLRNSSSAVSRSFFILSLLLSFWAVTNYLTDKANQLTLNILFNKLSFLFGFWALMAALAFSYFFTGRKFRHKTAVILGALVVSVLSITSLVSGTVEQRGDKLIFTSGPLIELWILAVVLGFSVIIYNFYKLAKTGDKTQKNQAKIIAISFGASITIGMLTNVIIPLFSDSFQTTKYGPPILSVCLLGGIGYAIVKHKLFDIRPIVARSFAYVLSLVFIGLIYVGVAFEINQYFFSGSSITATQEIFYLLLTLLTALMFPTIKTQFDRLTNSIFYRDAYDPQAFLDELNSVLVTTMDLKDLLQHSSRIINKYLKSEFSTFIIRSSTKNYVEVQGLHHLHFHSDEINTIREILHPSKTTVIQTITMDNSGQLYELSHKYAVAAIVGLVTKEEEVGYLLFGQKKSGNVYSGQDEKIMEIIGEELAIAAQNSLRFEEIKQFNVTLQDKINAATKELRHANTKLRGLDKSKDEFISMASHQLRTPLTVVKGYISMVLEGYGGKLSKDQMDMLQKAYEGADQMVFLVGDLLNVSRLQTGKFVIDNHATDLAKLIQTEVDQLQESAQNHHLELIYKKPENFPMLNLDETKIRQVVMNFIDNAIYYTPAGGKVEIALEATDQTVSCTVTDTGLGVPKAVQHHLFTRFYRADNARKMRPDGTGLGLYMAKKVITVQGGSIIFRSTEGKGSTFGFNFPRSAIEVKPQAEKALAK